MELYILFVGAYGLICFLIGEFFGRAKHIGRWWTMFLFWVSPIPVLGLIALISSPKANKEVKGKSVKWANWVFIALLILTILSLVNWLISLYQFLNIGNNFYAFKHRMSMTFFLSFGLNTVYFYLFSRGRIVNQSPKNYFGKFRMLNQEKIGKVKFSAPNINFKSDNNHLYYIKKDNETEQEGPYDFNELKKQRVKSGSWVWRKGLDQWVKVDELKELEPIIVHLPPEFKVVNDDSGIIEDVKEKELQSAINDKLKDESVPKICKIIKLKNDKNLEFYDVYRFYKRSKVTIDGVFPENGLYWSKDKDEVYEIINGIFHMEYYILKNKIKGIGTLKIGVSRLNGLDVNSPVWMNDGKVPDGIYEVGFVKKIIIKDNRITDIKGNEDLLFIIVSVLLTLAIIVFASL